MWQILIVNFTNKFTNLQYVQHKIIKRVVGVSTNPDFSQLRRPFFFFFLIIKQLINVNFVNYRNITSIIVGFHLTDVIGDFETSHDATFLPDKASQIRT